MVLHGSLSDRSRTGDRMGVLTDLVVVEESRVLDVGASHNPSRDFDGIDMKGIDPVKLMHLKSALTGATYDPTWIRDFEFLAGDKDEGPWVMTFPADLRAAISNLRLDQVASSADAWIKTDAFSLDNWETGDVVSVLG